MIFQKNISCENLLENPLQMPQMNTLSMEKGDVKQYYLTIADAIAFQKEIAFLIQLGDLKGIERRFQETIIFDGLEDLASYCNTSGRTISRHFKECLHISVSDYILQQKLEKAVFLLKNSDLTLAEISNYLAFSSQSHFTVAFKKRYFTTPQKYREKFLNI